MVAMRDNLNSITVSGRDSTQGGSLLVINDDRRIEFNDAVSDVRRSMMSPGTPGFLTELADLVTSTADRSQRTMSQVRSVVIDVSDGSPTPGLQRSIEVLQDSLECPVHIAVEDSYPLEPADVVLSVLAAFDYERLTRTEDRVAAVGARWCPFWREPGGSHFGPISGHGAGPSVRDLAARWISAAPSRRQAAAILGSEELIVTSQPVTAIEEAYAYATFFTDVWRWLHGAVPLASWHHVRIDRAGGINRDPVLPLPRPDATEEASTPLSPEDVVNARTGIVTRLRPIRFRTPMPTNVRYVESQTADMSRIQSWASNIYNAGSSWGDAAAACAGATGEAIERYCGNVTDFSRLTFASHNELARAGRRGIDPRELVLFSDEQYANPRFPFVAFDRDLRTHWVPGISLVDQSDVLVPAALAFVNWNTGLSLYSPRTNPAYYPGIAAGTDGASALANALEEVVERDASMVWWWSGHRLPTAPDADATVAALVSPEWREQHGMRVSVTPLVNAVGIASVAVVVDSARQDLLTVGLAARSSPEAAVAKALLEALGLQESALDMQVADGGFWQSQKDSDDDGAVRPVRLDRAYLDSYSRTFRDVTDLFCQLQIQLDPRAARTTRMRVGASGGSGLAGLPSFARRDPDEYVATLAARGFEAFAVDLTTPDVAAAGWSVSRVVIPGLVPNFPTAFPPLGRRRLQEEPMRLGWTDHILAPHELYAFPMPYA